MSKVKFVQFTNESGGPFLIQLDKLIGVVEHRGKVMIRTVDDRGADLILETMDEVKEIIRKANEEE